MNSFCKLKKFSIVILILLVQSCSYFSKTPGGRIPSSEEGQLAMGIAGILTEFQKELQNDVSGLKACQDGLKKYFQALYFLSNAKGEFQTLSDGELKDIIDQSFNIRLEIRKKLKQLKFVSKGYEGCLGEVRNIMRALRYVEDYALGLLYKRDQSKNEKYVTLTGDGPHFLINPLYKGIFKNYQDLQSGDVILSRGNAYSSAAIARIGTQDAQFSHLTFVYKDNKGELHTSEAHIEIGNVVAPFRVHISQENARTVVFRYKDQAMAHAASEYMYKLISSHQKKGKNIEYDFSMDYKDGKQLFCSEVVSHGFKKVHGIQIPTYLTKFNKGLVPFLQQLGIKVTDKNIESFDTFAPADIDFDSDWDLIAEWRNPEKVVESRIKDAVLTKIFQYMEEKKYSFDPPGSVNFKASFAWLMRRVPFIKKAFKEKFPTNMKASQLKLFLVLDRVGEVMAKRLRDYQAHSDHILTPKELFDDLDRFREIDYNNYVAYKKLKRKERHHPKMNSMKKVKPLFHLEFHP